VGKVKRLKEQRRRLRGGFLEQISDRLTANFQRELRNSELWDEMVAEFGEKRAEEMLRECKAEMRPGLAPNESRDRPKDIS
jgi:uncharacterized protein YaaW (UPF0174 family)